MRFQEQDNSCGAACVKNLMLAMGVDIKTEQEVRKKAGTNRKGTTQGGIKRALKAYGHNSESFQFRLHRSALRHLEVLLRAGRPVVLCVDDWHHWVVVLARFRPTFDGPKTYLVVDPGWDADKASKEGPCQILSEEELKSRWQHGKFGFHGVGIFPR